jgi:hypothetical protein
MGKVKSSDSSSLRQYVSDFKDVFTSDSKVIICQACGKSIVPQQRSQVTQHSSGSKHTAAIARLKQKDRPGRQSLIGESSATSSSSGPSRFVTFATDLCKEYVSADIPLFKINNPEDRNFLPKYTQRDLPDESTFRKDYLPKCYKETLNKIKSIVRERKYLCVYRRNNRCKWKEGCNCCYWGSEKRSNPMREIIYSVMQGNVCNESYNNS